jgi:hypothetical protein
MSPQLTPFPHAVTRGDTMTTMAGVGVTRVMVGIVGGVEITSGEPLARSDQLLGEGLYLAKRFSTK